MKLKNLNDKVVLITGAGSGIGRATALLCARRGARLVLCDRNEAGLKETAESAIELGAEVFAHAVDVTDPVAMDEFADAVHARYDAVDLLINNAGIGVWGGFLDTLPADWDRQLDVNVKGVVHGCERFLPRMIERGQGGQVVNVSSAAGYVASPGMTAYSVTKFAVFGLSQALRMEMRPHNIGVTVCCPGPTDTPIIGTGEVRGANAEQRAAGLVGFFEKTGAQPEQVAETMLRAVGRNRAVAPVALEAHVMYYANRIAPPVALWLATRWANLANKG
ncbi:MAG TPA: SDR family NAD(P)-dependent oxidoreductase [Nocardioidaceae bacterium]|nr:SDR family NAD(P)-dependent oxidoreductase [Nocardioidaceae bacterium]